MLLHLLDFQDILIREEIAFYKYPNQQDNIKIQLLYEEKLINSPLHIRDFYSHFTFLFVSFDFLFPYFIYFMNSFGIAIYSGQKFYLLNIK